MKPYALVMMALLVGCNSAKPAPADFAADPSALRYIALHRCVFDQHFFITGYTMTVDGKAYPQAPVSLDAYDCPDGNAVEVFQKSAVHVEGEMDL